MADDWLDKASGKWLTGPEVEEHGGLKGRILRLGEEKMSDGNLRPVLICDIEGRERIFAVNVGASDKIRRVLGKRPSSKLIGARISFTTQIATNPRTQITGPAVRIESITLSL